MVLRFLLVPALQLPAGRLSRAGVKILLFYGGSRLLVRLRGGEGSFCFVFVFASIFLFACHNGRGNWENKSGRYVKVPILLQTSSQALSVNLKLNPVIITLASPTRG